MLVVRELAWTVTVQVQGSQAHRAHFERKPEYRPHACLHSWLPKPEPSRDAGGCQIGFENGPILLAGIHAGSFPEFELKLFDQFTYLVRGAHRAPWHVF